MKYIIISAVFFLSFTPAYIGTPIKGDCTCNDINLWGNVKIVDNHADFTVQIVDAHENIRVYNTPHTSKCGEWNFVDAHADFTIQIVDAHADFTIKYSDYPGLN